jgi:hypothetical protein
VIVTLAAAVCIGVWIFTYRSAPGAEKSDFGQIWFAAQALWHGSNPYELIGPGLRYDWPGHFYYPLPAALVALPLASIGRVGADVVFGLVSAATLAWVFTRFGITGLLMLASPAAVMALQLGQWSPLFTAALLVPAIGALFVVKPTIGAAMFAVRPTWWVIAGGVLLSGVAFALQPTWPLDWWHALRSTDVVGGHGLDYLPPLRRPGGLLLLLALLRWRCPEARLLMALALVPQTPLLYETLPLLLVAKNWKQVGWFVIAGWLNVLIVNLAAWKMPGVPTLGLSGLTIVVLLYLPALLMVLRRPNAGTVPGWIEGFLARLRVPAWIAGTASRPDTDGGPRPGVDAPGEVHAHVVSGPLDSGADRRPLGT